MNPIGVSTTWAWHGYWNSWVNFDGRMIQSPSGGAHWGGGMILNAFGAAARNARSEPGDRGGDGNFPSASWGVFPCGNTGFSRYRVAGAAV